MKNLLSSVEKYKSYASVPIRIIFAFYLYTALKARVYNPDVLHAFGEQLHGLSFPFPIFFAHLGTWSLLLAYVMVLIGWKVRLAAVPMIIYFGVAIMTYHLPEGHSIRQTMPALALMMMSIFLFINGAGKPSLDEGY